MVGSLRKLAARIPGGQKGFTLIEMIVVVGIIAVLAAVIVPNIGKFIGSGEQGAKDAEYESVQTALNAMMADKAVTTIVANTGGTGTPHNDWALEPSEDSSDIGTVPLYNPTDATLQYLQHQMTVYFYCWDAQGKITNLQDLGGFESNLDACP